MSNSKRPNFKTLERKNLWKKWQEYWSGVPLYSNIIFLKRMTFGDKAGIFTHQGHSLSTHEIDLHRNRLSQAIDKLDQSSTPFLHFWQCDPHPREDFGFLLSVLMAHQLGSRWYGLIHNVTSQWVSPLTIPPVLLGACPSFHLWLNAEPYLISLGVTWRQSHCPSPQPLSHMKRNLQCDGNHQGFYQVLGWKNWYD